jgi:hypothetical protein
MDREVDDYKTNAFTTISRRSSRPIINWTYVAKPHMWFTVSLLGCQCGGGSTRNAETLDSRFRGNDRGLERVPFQMTPLPFVLQACKKRDELGTMGGAR